MAAVLAATVVLGGAVAGASQASTTNLVANADLEQGLEGWFARAPFTVERVSPGHGGDWAALLTNTGPTTRTGALNDTVNTVAQTRAGHVYRARAYLRADVPGRVVAVRLMEYRGTTYLGERSTTVTLQDTDWHRVAVDYVAATDGASLDLNVLGRAVPAGGGFFVDDLKLTDRGPAAGAAAVEVPAGSSTSVPGTASPAPSAASSATSSRAR